ncbi:MAG: 4-hydroxy-tetrahydrodipicolinate reductase [Thermodesulfobacteriota bacterium]
MLKVAVTGAAGRMGKAIIVSVNSTEGVRLAGALERQGSPAVGRDAGEIASTGRLGVEITDDREAAFSGADVIIDFSHPDATIKTLEGAVERGQGMVIGTTGFSQQQRETIRELAGRTRVVMAPNMSVGVNLLLKLADAASRVIGDEYDIEIIEAHHRHKKDAPSGTAIRLAEVITLALDRDLEDVAVYARKGIIGERRPEEIGIQSIRAGDIVGDHTVIFATPGERIELTHKASSRETFSKGAVRAALWLVDRPKGLYDMQDVLGLGD